MWLKHALKLLTAICIFSACSSPDRQATDKLNSLSYAYHYRDLDSAVFYARLALQQAIRDHYDDAQAEAYNHLAFVDMARMQYDDAEKHLDSVFLVTDNKLEHFVARVQQMRLCQRRSLNREFYDYKELAQQELSRINEDRSILDKRQLLRLGYAEVEQAIVISTYYYYVGLERQSVDALSDIHIDSESDTIQYLNYLYNVGAGGFVSRATQHEVNQVEFDYLMRCFLLAKQTDCFYFAANSLEALAEHLSDEEERHQLMTDNQPAMTLLNPENVPDDSIAYYLAQQALSLFVSYGDTYQIAGAYRTLATCCLAQDNYEKALDNLIYALSDTLIFQAPDLVASIHEQLSVAYAAVDDKLASDFHRNAYLDLQEHTRQDKWLEARAAQLDASLSQLNQLLLAVVVAMLLFLIVVVAFYFYRRRSSLKVSDETLDEQFEEITESLALSRLHVEQGQRLQVEQQAKVSLVTSIMPLIDRMILEARRVAHGDSMTDKRISYIRELTDNINEQNDILTHWIQLHKGELSVHVESFALQSLFDIVAKGRRSFSLKGVKLDVRPTDFSVKADKVLTLFMLNTLADNARKFTSQGGLVTISASATDAYVEIAVEDTGSGMSEESLSHIFDHKAITDSVHSVSDQGHGFGLLNCKGIIEKYRKISQVFSVCTIGAQSQEGRGSRFFFRLPRKLMTLLVLFILCGISVSAQNALERASVYADSAYFSNINGTYQLTLDYADSCRHYLNAYYLSQHPHSSDTLLSYGHLSATPVDVQWFHGSLRINYQVLLDLRNESAVAALALHQWSLYQYNNRIYTQLFKELSADASLDEYCRTTQQSQTNKQVAIVLLVILFLSLVVLVVWQLMILHNRRFGILQKRRDELELMTDELQRLRLEEARLHVTNAVLDNTLSSLKHETMYYPSRIRQLLESNDREALLELTLYYRELYGIFSQQASLQFEHTKLSVCALPHEVLGNAVCIDYLFEILRKQSGCKSLDVEWQVLDERYVTAHVLMPSLQSFSDSQLLQLFLPMGVDNIPYLICRQIVRWHAETTNRHGCGIKAQRNSQQQTKIIIILPRIWKTSK